MTVFAVVGFGNRLFGKLLREAGGALLLCVIAHFNDVAVVVVCHLRAYSLVHVRRNVVRVLAMVAQTV